jgi:hypothetical protein
LCGKIETKEIVDKMGRQNESIQLVKPEFKIRKAKEEAIAKASTLIKEKIIEVKKHRRKDR